MKATASLAKRFCQMEYGQTAKEHGALSNLDGSRDADLSSGASEEGPPHGQEPDPIQLVECLLVLETNVCLQ